MDNRLLEIVACPLCQGRLLYDKANQQMICRYDRVAYPVQDGIPQLLIESAVPLTASSEQEHKETKEI
ncbi:Trm112 family protein [Pasteurellaceae bacterium LIM206]|nr:Trm112 family protein [Pasteurellaceae bacterium LIM206]